MPPTCVLRAARLQTNSGSSLVLRQCAKWGPSLPLRSFLHAQRPNFSTTTPKRPFQADVSRRIRPLHIRFAHDDGSATLPSKKKKKKSRILKYLYKSFAYFGIFVAGTGIAVIAFFIYDATTYNEDLTSSEIPVSELALHPRRGGPKNLPIVDHFIDDDESEACKMQKHKPKLVVLGTGWGNIAMLKKLIPGEYHVTVISPSNYFLFTPMLPSGTVGTLELRSLVEPVRRIISRVKGHFLKGTAMDVDFSEKLVEVASLAPDGEEIRYYLPYDKLVVGVGTFPSPFVSMYASPDLQSNVGAVTNPHGVKGLEHCHFLKDIDDARRIRNRVVSNLERACLPTTSDEERKRLLSFVVSGGGPTGVEFAAELFDMLNEDLSRYYPKLLRNEISVHVIQSRSHILNTYEEALSKYAEERFAHDQVDVLTNARVKEVHSDRIVFTQRDPGTGNVEEKELPTGFCLWSTGVSQNPLVSTISNRLSSDQRNRHALETDTHLRVAGTPLGDVYAIGDASTVRNNAADHIITFLRTLAFDKGKDPEAVKLTFTEWRTVARDVRKRFPQAAGQLKRLDKLFEQYDKDHSGTLDFAELHELLTQIDAKMTTLPATAQRAHQQGIYLAHKLNKLAQSTPALKADGIIASAGDSTPDLDEKIYRAFEYRHMGSLAYIGNSAVFDFGDGLGFSGGLLAVYLWRSVYFAQSVSFRTRVLLAMDWGKRALFGRDLMNF